ncbi:MAG: DUF4198 domain-containing protein [Desulfobulbaceae bacterium]|nr:DUF4198 domain-containing protein [Desulfobulbaceae bacterium]MDP2105242.1 hypothetical protein [Desulfobulbaceae bacterium]
MQFRLVTRLFLVAVTASALCCSGSAVAAVQPLWLGLAPNGGKAAGSPIAKGGKKEEQKPSRETEVKGESAGKAKSASGGHWHGAGGKPERFESGHRPLPVRTYYLKSPLGSGATVNALVQKADGSVMPVEPAQEAGNVKISFPASMGEGPMHGPNNVYVVESQVKGDILVLRTAKWCTLHHNCGWGHDHKFDSERIAPRSCLVVPFEIVVRDLWDGNFHSRLMSGDMLALDVLYQGKPAPFATVRVTSEKGWSREVTTDADGHAAVQLIRDYYPASWSLFERNQLGEVRIEARYAVDQVGSFNGLDYRRVEMVSTFPWRYNPARREYTSLVYGLLIVTVAMAVSGLGIYIHRERRRRPRREIVFDEE